MSGVGHSLALSMGRASGISPDVPVMGETAGSLAAVGEVAILLLVAGKKSSSCSCTVAADRVFGSCLGCSSGGKSGWTHLPCLGRLSPSVFWPVSDPLPLDSRLIRTGPASVIAALPPAVAGWTCSCYTWHQSWFPYSLTLSNLGFKHA